MPWNLGVIDRIPRGEGKTFEVGGRQVAVFRGRKEELYATQAACPHKGGPLADGIVGGGTVICPRHGCRYDLQTGGALGSGCSALRTYRIELGAGRDVLLFLEEK